MILLRHPISTTFKLTNNVCIKRYIGIIRHPGATHAMQPSQTIDIITKASSNWSPLFELWTSIYNQYLCYPITAHNRELLTYCQRQKTMTKHKCLPMNVMASHITDNSTVCSLYQTESCNVPRYWPLQVAGGFPSLRTDNVKTYPCHDIIVRYWMLLDQTSYEITMLYIGMRSVVYWFYKVIFMGQWHDFLSITGSNLYI